MKLFILFCFTLIIAIAPANALDFNVRDSSTGEPLLANISVQLIDRDAVDFSTWRNIKLGNPIPNDIALSVFGLKRSNNSYAIKISQYLQVLTIKADGYRTLRTTLDANEKVKLTRIMLDRSPLHSHVSNSCPKNKTCGHIYDKNTLLPLENASVTLSNNQKRYSALSNVNGRFIIEEQTPKNATLSIEIQGYRSQIWYSVPFQSQLNMVVDMQKGQGVNEKTMRHPLNDVANNRINQQWLSDKLSQQKTQDASPSSLEFRERSSGAVYLQPPASIRVGFNGSGGTCCGGNCSTSEVYSLETYVQRGMDDEWIASWQSNSLKAGSIPYRSYGAWHVLNEVYTGYDICAGPCCQAFGFNGHSATIAAGIATNGIMLDKNGEVARSEYSAQNNSWDDPNDGLNCNNNDLSCGDGSVGSPDTGWPCLSDPLATGRGCFGHGRGMSQWGTQFHAQNNENFANIVDHYYNASNNPSQQRSQYASTPIRFDSISASSDSVSENEVFTIDYELYNATNDMEPFGPLLLGASLISDANSYSDSANDFPLSLTQSGLYNVSRHFQVPDNIIPGVYDLAASVYLDVNADNDIAAVDWKLVIMVSVGALTVLNENDLIFKDSF